MSDLLVNRYKINDDMSIDVYEDVYITEYRNKSLEVKFNIIHGDFVVEDSDIESMLGFPKEIEGCFRCNNTNIESLDNSPKVIKGFYNVRDNKINDISNIPTLISGFIDLQDNNIEDFSYLNKTISSSIFIDIDINDISLYMLDISVINRIKCICLEDKSFLESVIDWINLNDMLNKVLYYKKEE